MLLKSLMVYFAICTQQEEVAKRLSMYKVSTSNTDIEDEEEKRRKKDKQVTILSLFQLLF